MPIPKIEVSRYGKSSFHQEALLWSSKTPYTLSVTLSDFIVWRHTWRKNWVNCTILTGNSAGLRTVLSSRLSHRELRSSFSKSHSFLILPADTTMASSQGTSVSSNSFSRWASHDIFLFKHHFLLHILRFLFFFSDNIMVDVASKQQYFSLVFIHHSHTKKSTHRTDQKKKKTDKPDRKPLLCQRTFSSVFPAIFFYTVKLHGLTESEWGPLESVGPLRLTSFYFKAIKTNIKVDYI